MSIDILSHSLTNVSVDLELTQFEIRLATLTSNGDDLLHTGH